ncbi:FMN-dependent NADH-azoreductase [Herbaspirillum lusitanum]|uniref:FMN-dependent NADH-azoreductase n=1 Tax=Herbaspirillum lusitanum TaxID=213312 RepID=UPI0022383EBE|nr:FMN-dependent NADH-azoreductase [Herbaspirillum lusitanum]MCW5298575.1 FMN-dependent NADH-azoreductase [Herbaspirillum lusitanum]
MSTLLHIDSSARYAGSLTRQLSAAYVEQWQAKNAGGKVVQRDLASHILPHITEAMIGAYFTPADQRSAEQQAIIAESDKLVDELIAADTLVIGVPMYNFAPPSAFKAWVDHISRVGRTFSYGANGPAGLLTGKRAIVILSSGGVYSEGPAQPMDFNGTYIRSVLGFLGITDVELITAEGVSMGEEKARQTVSQAQEKISAIV